MAVDELDRIDIMSTDKTDGTLRLTISDHLDWTDTLTHQLVLQEKINRYLAFIESGEILEHRPDARENRIGIRVVMKYEPDLSGLVFLGQAAEFVSRAGFDFCYRVVPIAVE